MPRSPSPPALCSQLSREELAGVIAHELAHIKHHDTLLMTITATIAGAISMLAQFGMFFGGNRDNNGPGIIGSIADDDPRAARRHAGADGDQPHPRICRRRSRRAHLRPADVARLGAGQDRQAPRIRSRTWRPSATPRPRTCSSSIRCRAMAWTICSPPIPRRRTASRRLQQLAAELGAQARRQSAPTKTIRRGARGDVVLARSFTRPLGLMRTGRNCAL